ncbi:MAG: hypothetical protein ABIG70_09830 [Pseudomonadota bacterium]
MVPEKNSIQALPWAVVLTTAALAIISALLVFHDGWEPWWAFLVVAMTALGIILSLLAAMLIMSSPEDRAGNWQIVISTARSDLDILLKYFRIRKRM